MLGNGYQAAHAVLKGTISLIFMGTLFCCDIQTVCLNDNTDSRLRGIDIVIDIMKMCLLMLNLWLDEAFQGTYLQSGSAVHQSRTPPAVQAV